MLRPEHPNPQFERENFFNLNGKWQFEIDNDRTGFERKLLYSRLKSEINVPYCPESQLSGVEYKGFINACWYKRAFAVSEPSLKNRITINFGAVDYYAIVFINGKEAGRHVGGYTPFCMDITTLVKAGDNEVTVYVEDDTKADILSGKQSFKQEPFGCFYTRCTGIWQTVFVEVTPRQYIKSIKLLPNVSAGAVELVTVVEGEGVLQAEVLYQGRQVGFAKCSTAHKSTLTVSLTEQHLWEHGIGRLYDVVLRFGEDTVRSYFGLREVGFKGMDFYLNDKPLFQRLVLDQGYYPEGIYTAQSVADFVRDIELAVSLGFNGARLHQKAFEPRYLYECDKAGFMVWGEMPSWGIKYDNVGGLGGFISEWTEMIERDFNHPSVVIWCPLNEVWSDWDNSNKVREKTFVEAVYAVTKLLDPTRPCIDASGGYHTSRTDVMDYHCYLGYDEYKQWLDALNQDRILSPYAYVEGEGIKYQSGTPIILSEFGGIAFGAGMKSTEVTDIVKTTDNWGYLTETDEDSFVKAYTKLAIAALNNPKLSGFCYTQLYDIEQEQNGFFTYDRKDKLSASAKQAIADCNKHEAATEKRTELFKVI